jgi:catechol-2,3-dioxygenase
MNHFGIKLPNIGDFDRMVKHLARYNNISTAQRASLSANSILIQDPDGIRIEVYTN